MNSRDIPDGCTRHATLGLNAEGITLWCDFRPLTAGERLLWAARIARLSLDGDPGWRQAELWVFQRLARQVVFWNLRDAHAAPLPITPHTIAELPSTLAGSLFACVTGVCDVQNAIDHEQQFARELAEGICFTLQHPALARRECDDCLRYVYDETTGQRALHLGLPVERPRGTSAPCRLPQVGCPKGSPEAPRTLSESQQRAWLFDLECRAIGRYPHDLLVARHAAIIRAAELDAVQQSSRLAGRTAVESIQFRQ